jgi:glutamyl-tRNA synthetase
MSPTVVRFAPSPTGNLHIGNARTALINWLYARQRNGKFILRLDDTDRERSKQEFADGIVRDLEWLGIGFDQKIRQSDRDDRHREATQRLIGQGLLYPCYESAEELERKRRRLAARGMPPVYDRAALTLTNGQKAEMEKLGRSPHYRFLLPNFDDDPHRPVRTEVHWDDLVAGNQTVDLASISDPVLVREDGSWLYTLPSVVDDVDTGVTHVIRGADHITNTGVQITIFEALGAKRPEFGHHNLLTTSTGEGLSKRLGSLSIMQLARDGYEAMAVASLATLIGGAGAIEPMADMDALARRFDISDVGKSAAKFDEGDLDSLNRKLVHALEWDSVKDRFGSEPFGGHGEAFWMAVRENLDRTKEAETWWHALENAEPAIEQEDLNYIAAARDCLPPGPFDQDSWGEWTGKLKELTGRKGRALFMPLRKALTGMERGPEMAALLPIIGREKTLDRLS